jgi:hypothetical protein
MPILCCTSEQAAEAEGLFSQNPHGFTVRIYLDWSQELQAV